MQCQQKCRTRCKILSFQFFIFYQGTCTFTTTGRKGNTADIYECKTCNMVDGLSICSHCVKVCHVDHEVEYLGYGHYYCDCGDPDNKTCHVIVSEEPGRNYTVDCTVQDFKSELDIKPHMHKVEISIFHYIMSTNQPKLLTSFSKDWNLH